MTLVLWPGWAFERASTILAASVGTGHQAYLMTLNNLGMIEARAGHSTCPHGLRAALAAGDPLRGDAYGPELNLGNLDRQLGHVADARRHFTQALAVAEATQGKTSDRVAESLYSLGTLAIDDNKLDEAEPLLQRALAILAPKYGDNHGQSAVVLDGLGFVYARRHDCRHAVIYQQRAIAGDEATFGHAHPSVAEALTSLAACQLELHDKAAIDSAERAVAIYAGFPAFDPYRSRRVRAGPSPARWPRSAAIARAPPRSPARPARSTRSRRSPT